jgi:tRNA(Ile)-lysidine synthase
MASSGTDPVGRVLDAGGLILDRARLIGSRRPVVVAVSGGADSLCLLDTLVTLLDRATARIVVGHVDHCLRPESSDDAAHVCSIASGYGVRSEIIRVDVPALMASEGRGLEDAARVGRYRALRDVCARVGGGAVLTGHTRDDSIETVLMHLIRGSGRTGLGGMAETVALDAIAHGSEHVPSSPRARVVRPLLNVGRADTVAYCVARHIRWLTDPSNADPALLRNRVRGHLLPVLRTYNPAIDEALGRLAQVVRDEDAYLDRLAERRYRRLAAMDGGQVTISLADWAGQPLVLLRRLVRRIGLELGLTELSRDAVERALAVGHNDGPRRAELSHGLTVERRHDTLLFKSSGRANQEGDKHS